MTDTIALRQRINDSGFKMKYLADQLCISQGGFSLKVRGRRGFYAMQIKKLCEILHISPEEMQQIFFADVVDLKSTNEVGP